MAWAARLGALAVILQVTAVGQGFPGDFTKAYFGATKPGTWTNDVWPDPTLPFGVVRREGRYTPRLGNPTVYLMTLVDSGTGTPPEHGDADEDAASSTLAAEECCALSLPGPFGDADQEAMLRALYPQLDPGTGRLGVKSGQGVELYGKLYESAMLTDEGGRALLAVLIVAYEPSFERTLPQSGTGSGLDLALYGLKAGKPILVASLRGASFLETPNRFGSALLRTDLRIRDDMPAIGIESGSGHGGDYSRDLRLFDLEGDTLREVFAACTWSESADRFGDELLADLTPEEMGELYPPPLEEGDIASASRSTVASVRSSGSHNDLMVTKHVLERAASGKLLVRTEKTRWSFDEEKGDYRATGPAVVEKLEKRDWTFVPALSGDTE